MIPYSNFYYFFIMFLILIPAIVLGLSGKRIKWYGLFSSLFVMILMFSTSKLEMIYLIVFYLVELFLVYSFMYIRKKNSSRWILWIMVLLATLPLLYSKFGSIFTHKMLGFLGISYVTFKAIQMIIEIYDKRITEINVADFTYFLLFFPTLSSGPIDRSQRFIKEINAPLDRKQYLEYLGEGIWKILIGMAYKFILAYYINNLWLKKIPINHQSLMITLNYMYAYSFYLFFDFAGYSRMAIGVGYILGVKTPENFNLPFLSKDIKDFWNRWHITLSFWFRDYIYNRFVMAAIKKKWFKNRYTASYIAYGLTMCTMGFWHGTYWNYILYGVYHSILLISTDYLERHVSFYKKVKNNPVWVAFSTLITFNLVCFGFLLFSGYLIK